MGPMPLRVAMLAAECEPWAKVGGLGDMVDALRAHSGGSGRPRRVARRRSGPGVPSPLSGRSRTGGRDRSKHREVRVPDPRAPAGSSTVSVIDVEANGYLLRLVDHPAAFDRAGIYGDAAGEYADNAWRYGLFCRRGVETLRTDVQPVDVLHLHDWHGAPAVIYRDTRYADEPSVASAAVLETVHNLAYRGWTPRSRLGQLGLGTRRRGRRLR